MSNDQRTLAGLKMPSAGWADKAGGAGHDVERILIFRAHFNPGNGKKLPAAES